MHDLPGLLRLLAEAHACELNFLHGPAGDRLWIHDTLCGVHNCLVRLRRAGVRRADLTVAQAVAAALTRALRLAAALPGVQASPGARGAVEGLRHSTLLLEIDLMRSQ